MKSPTRRMLLLLACVLVAELACFSQGGRIVAEEDERPASSVEQQLYKMPRPQEHLGSGSPPDRMYEASARPVPQGSNPLHNR
ncbi:hypothetical protein PVAP13_9KG133900 [Panicum virgatum]|uniref:CLAVATA3/ESR (CLE)-related protein n=1 Tax=Panicum virgatum TaxID=38727 RepID=A0A8T0NFU9_PANVG|nr:hypothetical protein PVAP13_9KG133900 [Panicum virgatum]